MFASKSLKSSVAQLCIPLGWQNANVSAIEVSNDIVKRFLQRVGTLAARFAELGGRYEGNLDDLALAFDALGIRISDLDEYVNNVETPHLSHKVYAFPIHHPCSHVFETTTRVRRVKNRKVDSHTGEGEEGEGDAESDSDEDVIPPYLPPLPGKDAYQNEDDRESGIHVSDGEFAEMEAKEPDGFTLGQSGLPQYIHKRLRSTSVEDEDAVEGGEVKSPRGGIKSPLAVIKSPLGGHKSPSDPTNALSGVSAASPQLMATGGFYSTQSRIDDAGSRDGLASKRAKPEKMPSNKGLPIPGRHPASSTPGGKARKEKSEQGKGYSHKKEQIKTPKITIKLPKKKGEKGMNRNSNSAVPPPIEGVESSSSSQLSLPSEQPDFGKSELELNLEKLKPNPKPTVFVEQSAEATTVDELGETEMLEKDNFTSQSVVKSDFKPFSEESSTQFSEEQNLLTDDTHAREEYKEIDSLDVEDVEEQVEAPKDEEEYLELLPPESGGGAGSEVSENDCTEDDGDSTRDEFIDVGADSPIVGLLALSDSEASTQSIPEQDQESPITHLQGNTPKITPEEGTTLRLDDDDENARSSFKEEADEPSEVVNLQKKLTPQDIFHSLSISDSSDESSMSDFSPSGPSTPVISGRTSPTQQPSLVLGDPLRTPQEPLLLTASQTPPKAVSVSSETTKAGSPFPPVLTGLNQSESHHTNPEDSADSDEVYSGMPVLAPTPGLVVKSLGVVEQLPASGLIVKINKKGLKVPSKKKGHKRPRSSKGAKPAKRRKSSTEEELRMQSVPLQTGNSETPPTGSSSGPTSVPLPGLLITRTVATTTSSEKLFQGQKVKSPSLKRKDSPKQQEVPKPSSSSQDTRVRVKVPTDSHHSTDVAETRRTPLSVSGSVSLKEKEGSVSSKKKLDKKKKKKIKDVSLHKKKSKSKPASSGLTVSSGKIKQVSPLATVSTKMATSHSSPGLMVKSGGTINQTPLQETKVTREPSISPLSTKKLKVKSGSVASVESKRAPLVKDSDESTSSDSSSDVDMSDDGSSASGPSVASLTTSSSGLIVQSLPVVIGKSSSQPLPQPATATPPLVYYCPVCKQPDDGRPMVACDVCNDDRWYHWVCVGITTPPKETDPWFCPDCVKKSSGRKKKKPSR